MAGDLDPRTPVLVGVGTSLHDVEAAELMARATVAAADDARAPSLLGAVERIAVPTGTWSYTDPARIVAARIVAANAETHLLELGLPQQTPINQALTAIMAGEIDVAVVVGAEAKARAARAGKRNAGSSAAGIVDAFRRDRADADQPLETDQGGAAPDVLHTREPDFVPPAEREAQLWVPVEQYALMESALRAVEGESIDDHRREIAELWARCNEVARTNPEAAFPAPMTAAEIAELGPRNRPLAFPYGKWHASQWTVDQGAALLLCSAEAAERHGVPRDRWVFPLVGLESSVGLALTQRRHLHRWPAMGVLGRAAVERVGRPLRDCEHTELYSCFPVAVRIQQRELDLPLDATPTVTGGMAFAGGPFNNFVLQSTAAIVRKLRAEPGLGLVTTVCGFLTKPGLAVYGSAPDGLPPLVADLAAEAAAASETAEVLSSHDGDARVVAYTITYDTGAPHELVAITELPGGDRVIARSNDAALIARGMREELVGRVLRIRGNTIAPASVG